MEIKDLSANILKIQKVKNIKCPTCKKVAVKSFYPFCSKKCSKKSLQFVSNQAIKLAEVEGLHGHAFSINIRNKT